MKKIVTIAISIKIAIILSTSIIYGQQQQNETVLDKFDYDKNVNSLIGDLIEKCGDMKTDSCIETMFAVNNFCQIAYFPNCFGEEWTPFIDFLKEMAKNGTIVDRDDSFITLNNEHFGSDNMTKFKELLEK